MKKKTANNLGEVCMKAIIWLGRRYYIFFVFFQYCSSKKELFSILSIFRKLAESVGLVVTKGSG